MLTMNENKALDEVLKMDEHANDLETALKALSLFRELLDTSVDEMEAEADTAEHAAEACGMFINKYDRYEASLDLVQQSLEQYKANMDKATKGAYEALKADESQA